LPYNSSKIALIACRNKSAKRLRQRRLKKNQNPQNLKPPELKKNLQKKRLNLDSNLSPKLCPLLKTRLSLKKSKPNLQSLPRIFSEISFKDKPVDKTETPTPQPEGYGWLKKAARKDSEEPAVIKEQIPQSPRNQ